MYLVPGHEVSAELISHSLNVRAAQIDFSFKLCEDVWADVKKDLNFCSVLAFLSPWVPTF